MGSSRLPGKTLKEINGLPLLELLLKRINKSRHAHKIIVATSHKTIDNPIETFCNQNHIPCFRGSENDVLDRFYQSIIFHTTEQERKNLHVIRITADCPLHHYQVIDKCIEEFQSRKIDYFSNSNQPPVLEDGCDTEIFTFSSLKAAWENAQKPSEREHVTPYIKNCGKYKCEYQKCFPDYQYKLSVDNENDFKLAETIFRHFAPDILFSIENILNLLKEKPELLEINKTSKINEGYYKSLKRD